MKIGNFTLGATSPVYLIAEMSANHNGSLENAKKTIKSAKECGANAIKIQTYTPDTLTIRSDRPEFLLKGGLWDGRQLYDLYKDAQTPYEWHEELFKYAAKCGITLFSTPFDDTAIELLEELNTPAYKIASFELIDLPLIERVAKCKKPLLMSTGAATLNEITEAVQVARKFGAEEILLFHCISSYPAPINESHLNIIKILKNKYGVLVGLSDHSIGSDAGFLSVALGVDAIEKHFIIDRAIGGPDSEFSATPPEFMNLRSRVDLARTMMGGDNFNRSKSEKQSSTLRRSIYFVNNKKRGEVITKDDIKVIRPGLGLHPRYFSSIVGSRLEKDVFYGEPALIPHFPNDFDKGILKSTDFTLEEITPTRKQEVILYHLLLHRKGAISHKNIPTLEEHINFVKNHPYRGWWLIYDLVDRTKLLGSVYVNSDNSVGLQLYFEYIGFTALFFTTKLKNYIEPKPPQPSKIYGDYFYNVAPNNYELTNWLSESKYIKSQCSFSPDISLTEPSSI